MYSASKDDISNLKSTTSNLRSAASDTASGVRDDMSKAGNKVLSLIRSAGGELSHAKDSVTSHVRSNPVRSSAIALGVGLLVGALLRR